MNLHKLLIWVDPGRWTEKIFCILLQLWSNISVDKL